MSKPDSGHFHGANGKSGGTPQENTSNQTVNNLANKLPPNDSQIKHMFRNAEGHLPNTLENHKLIETVANDPANYKGKDKFGKEWYSRMEPDGSQIWAWSFNGVIRDAGKNSTPKEWDPETGYCRNPKKVNKWRRPK